MIVVENLAKTFDHTTAVKDVSFTVEQGKTLVLLGTSGCGKTTTLKMINRLIVPDAGKVWIGDEDAAHVRPEMLRRKIGYVLQHNGLFPHYTIAENIAVVPALLGWDKTKIRTRVFELLEKLKLPADYAALYPHQLSGGQQQRVGIARALAARPPVLLMDEPFGALDPLTRAATKKDLAAVDEFKDKTIIIVTHDVQEAVELGDEICLMDKGRIVQKGTAEALLFQPANDFVRTFFSEQQLSLELRTLHVGKLWAFLPGGNSSKTNIEVGADEPLWRVLEQLIAKDNTEISIKNEANEIKYAGYSALMNAFAQYRK
jgi:osmoprotectant transport system ATP-binding protein